MVGALYTRFKSLRGGFVRDYEKLEASEALSTWFLGDLVAWQEAHEQIRRLSHRWHPLAAGAVRGAYGVGEDLSN